MFHPGKFSLHSLPAHKFSVMSPRLFNIAIELFHFTESIFHSWKVCFSPLNVCCLFEGFLLPFYVFSSLFLLVILNLLISRPVFSNSVAWSSWPVLCLLCVCSFWLGDLLVYFVTLDYEVVLDRASLMGLLSLDWEPVSPKSFCQLLQV